MSDFKVEVRSIGSLAVHPNADKLEIAHLNGLMYPFVVGKGQFSINELVVYFPLDALIPNALASLIGLPVKEGKPFRVKSIRLRGSWSEGVLASLSVIGLDPKLAEDGLDLTEKLGVVKYEPNDPTYSIFKGVLPSNLQALPTTVRKYDIENLQRYPAVYEQLKDQEVFITEKLEGTHFWARIDADGETIHVGQRNYEIKRGDVDKLPDHPFWKTFYSENLDGFLYWLSSYYRGYDVTIRGELIGDGVQGNYYKLPKGKLEVYLFEIELNGVPVDAQVFYNLIQTAQSRFAHPPRVVPVLRSWGTLAEYATSVENLIERANGKTVLDETDTLLREGIVIKPMVETYSPEIGRCFTKVRDAAYLEKTGN